MSVFAISIRSRNFIETCIATNHAVYRGLEFETGLSIRSRNCSNVVFRTILTRGSRGKHLLQTSSIISSLKRRRRGNSTRFHQAKIKLGNVSMRNERVVGFFLKILFYKYSIILSNRILDRSEVSFSNIIIVIITSILVKKKYFNMFTIR